MVIIRAEQALAVGVATTTNRLDGRLYRNVGPGIIKLVALGSVADMNYTLSVGGVPLQSLPTEQVPFSGATGGLNGSDNIVLEQKVAGGEVQLTFTSGSSSTTVDYICSFEPMRK